MYNLNREEIINSIYRFYGLINEPCNVSDFQEMNGTRRRVFINERNGEKFHLDFHFKSNGTTSIDKSSGKKLSIKDKIKDFILADEECILGGSQEGNKCYITPNINYHDFVPIMELLIDSENYKDHTITEDNIFIRYDFIGAYNESLSIHYYKSKEKLMLQGRPLLLFTETMTLITELIELDDIPNFFNENYKVNILKSDIEEQFNFYFPLSKDYQNNKLKRVLHQAVYNLQIEGEMFSYSYIVFPALRALEGHLKYAFYDYGIELEENRFKMFSYSGMRKKHILDTEYHSIVKEKKDYFEKAYNFYRRQRHSLFHWEDPYAPRDETRIIDNIGEAKGIIRDVFYLIEEYYQ